MMTILACLTITFKQLYVLIPCQELFLDTFGYVLVSVSSLFINSTFIMSHTGSTVNIRIADVKHFKLMIQADLETPHTTKHMNIKTIA